MQRKIRLVIIIGLLVLSVMSVRHFAARPALAKPPAQDENLLNNPGFEGRFQSWNGIPEIQVAANWTPWWWEDADHNPPYFRPEYKRAEAAYYPNRVLSGESAQQWFTFHASHVAGMYQQVFNATPGRLYRFTIWAQVWSSVEDNPYTSVLPANPHLQVGIDPTGFWNAGSADVIWSAEAPMSGIIDQWGEISVEAKAEGDIITVFMRTRPDFANKHNDIYWDHASLVAVSSSPPTPYPATITVDPAGEPPKATNTQETEKTPIATRSTPQITASATASKTPSPTDSPSATNTQEPTWTPKPVKSATHTATVVLIESATAAPTITPTSSSPELVDSGQIIADSTDSSDGSIKSPGPDVRREEARESGDRQNNSNFLLIFAIGLAIAVGYVVISKIVRRNRTG